MEIQNIEGKVIGLIMYRQEAEPVISHLILHSPFIALKQGDKEQSAPENRDSAD